MRHASKDPRRLRRIAAAQMDAEPLTVTRWGDVIVWRGDGYYSQTTDGRLVPSRTGLHIKRGDLLQ